MSKEGKPVKGRVLPTILPEIRSLIEMARHHAAVTANLALVNLYWNIGRVITQDIQKNEKRAGYGEQLVEEVARVLTKEYGQGYSARNLWDMKRFYTEFLPEAEQMMPGVAADVLNNDYHRWKQGLTKEQLQQQLEFYKKRYGEGIKP